MSYLDHFEKRKNARFVPHLWEEYEFYDCVTFCVSMKVAHGVIEKPTFPRYNVSDKKGKMYEVVRTGFGEHFREESLIEATEDEKRAKIKAGDILFLSFGKRGHHCGIVLEDLTFAHCVKNKGVTVDPLSDRLLSQVHFRYS